MLSRLIAGLALSGTRTGSITLVADTGCRSKVGLPSKHSYSPSADGSMTAIGLPTGHSLPAMESVAND
jgi:hypothetical protein